MLHVWAVDYTQVKIFCGHLVVFTLFRRLCLARSDGIFIFLMNVPYLECGLSSMFNIGKIMYVPT